MPSALLKQAYLYAVLVNSCQREVPLASDGQKWTPKDCGDFSIWDAEKKRCRCDEGWKGSKCDVWGNSTEKF